MVQSKPAEVFVTFCQLSKASGFVFRVGAVCTGFLVSAVLASGACRGTAVVEPVEFGSAPTLAPGLPPAQHTWLISRLASPAFDVPRSSTVVGKVPML